MLKRILKGVVVFVSALAGNLIAGWIQQNAWSNLFTPTRLAVTVVILVIAILLEVFLDKESTVARNGERKWLGQKWGIFLNKVNATLVSSKTRFENFRACLRGELEWCRQELKTEREKLREEKGKVDQLTLALATLSQHVLGLFDEKMEKLDELEWGGALSVSKQADRYARTALNHHVTKVVYYDPRYPASWMKADIPEQTRDFFVERWFVEKDAQQLKDWINRILEEGQACRSLIVFAKDIVPDTVVEVRNETCLLRKYLDAGGRVVWRGDVPFWYQGKSSGAKDEWGLEGPQKILGIDYTNHDFAYKSSNKFGGQIWDQDFPMQLTPAGYDIGLSYPRKRVRIRPVSSESVSVPYLLIQPETITLGPTVDWSDDKLTLCWKKNFNDNYRYGGFMQYITGEFIANEVNHDFFRFAVSGWPLLFGS
jgi:hypothetical protein